MWRCGEACCCWTIPTLSISAERHELRRTRLGQRMNHRQWHWQMGIWTAREAKNTSSRHQTRRSSNSHLRLVSPRVVSPPSCLHLVVHRLSSHRMRPLVFQMHHSNHASLPRCLLACHHSSKPLSIRLQTIARHGMEQSAKRTLMSHMRHQAMRSTWRTSACTTSTCHSTRLTLKMYSSACRPIAMDLLRRHKLLNSVSRLRHLLRPLLFPLFAPLPSVPPQPMAAE